MVGATYAKLDGVLRVGKQVEVEFGRIVANFRFPLKTLHVVGFTQEIVEIAVDQREVREEFFAEKVVPPYGSGSVAPADFKRPVFKGVAAKVA